MNEPLNIPVESPIDIVTIDGKTILFDPIRKKNIIYTPEEWVRQHFIRYLNESLGYSYALMSTERGLTTNQRLKRTDILVYDNLGNPRILVECKAWSVPLTNSVLYQATEYNSKLKAPCLILTNGLKHLVLIWNNKKGMFEQAQNIPSKDIVL